MGNFELGNLLYFVGEKLTLRTGLSGTHRRAEALSQNNFAGEQIFSSLESYRRAVFENVPDTDSTYRVTRGDPVLDMSQSQIALFAQNDLRLTNRFMLNLGLRFSKQTNINHNGGFDPRVGFAYAVRSSTVIQGGIGVFTQIVSYNTLQMLRRLDGTRQHEIQIDAPPWPDPFLSGSVRIVPPSSRRQAAPELLGQYYVTSAVTLEQSLPSNLFVSISMDYNRGVRLPRYRNLNAPLPITGEKPFPNEGHIYQFEGSGLSSTSM